MHDSPSHFAWAAGGLGFGRTYGRDGLVTCGFGFGAGVGGGCSATTAGVASTTTAGVASMAIACAVAAASMLTVAATDGSASIEMAGIASAGAIGGEPLRTIGVDDHAGARSGSRDRSTRMPTTMPTATPIANTPEMATIQREVRRGVATTA